MKAWPFVGLCAVSYLSLLFASLVLLAAALGVAGRGSERIPVVLSVLALALLALFAGDALLVHAAAGRTFPGRRRWVASLAFAALLLATALGLGLTVLLAFNR